MTDIHLDFETRSRLRLQNVGVHIYAADPSTEILCLCFAIDDGPVQLVTLEDLRNGGACPFDPAGARLITHNAEFERQIWREICVGRLGWPPIHDNQWHCTAAAAAYRALPRKLEQVAVVLDLKNQKDMGGHRTMQRLTRWLPATKPLPERFDEDPQKLQQLYRYCAQDVEVERELHSRL